MNEFIIKRGWNGRLVSLCASIGAEKGQELIEKIVEVVAASFEPNKAPMRNRTTREVSRRLDLVVEIVLQYRERRWPIVRIMDELSALMDEKLDLAEPKIRRDGVWAEKIKNPIPLVPDTGEEFEQ